jgi:hypothetical protein
MAGIEAGPRTEIVGVSGRTIEGMEVGEQVIVGIGGATAPFSWIDGGSGI